MTNVFVCVRIGAGVSAWQESTQDDRLVDKVRYLTIQVRAKPESGGQSEILRCQIFGADGEGSMMMEKNM